jgi:autotransporter translocation and assembly factor TamB
MKKAFFLLFLLVISLLVSAFSFGAWQDSLYDQIRRETIKGLKDNLNWEVAIGQVTGPVVGQVVFNDVVITGLATARSVTINFNPITFALKKDIVPALTAIKVENGLFLVERNQRDKWNVLSVLPPVQPGAPPPPPFRPKISFTNCRVRFVDQLGFGSSYGPFTETLAELNGLVSFQKADRISFKVGGKIHEKLYLTEVNTVGWINLVNGKFNIATQAENLNLGKWGNYVFPLANVNFKVGSANLSLTLTPPRTKGWPVALTGNLELSNVAVEYNRQLFQQTTGRLSFADDNLTINNLRTEFAGLPLTINGAGRNFLSPQADLTIVSGPPFAGQASLTLNRNILAINLSQLEAYRGKVSAIGQLALTGATPEVNLEAKLSNIDLASWSGFSGRASGRLTLNGPLNKIKGNSKFSVVDGQAFGQRLSALLVNFRFQDNELFFDQFESPDWLSARGRYSVNRSDLQLDYFRLAQGRSTVEAWGRLGLGPAAATRLEISGNNLELSDLTILQHFLPEVAKRPRGQAYLKLTVAGPAPSQLEYEGALSLVDAQVAAVPIKQGTFAGRWSPKSFDLSKCLVELPDSHFELKVSQNSDRQLAGSFSGLINLRHFRKLTESYGNIDGLLGLGLTISGTADQPQLASSFWLEQGRYNRFAFDRVAGAVSLNNQEVFITEPIKLQAGDDRYELSGRCSPNDLDLNLQVPSAEIASVIILADELQSEISSQVIRSFAPRSRLKLKVAHAAFPKLSAFPSNGYYLLYADSGKRASFLSQWTKATFEINKYIAALPENEWTGKFSGALKLQGPYHDLSGSFVGAVSNGTFRKVPFNKLAANVTLDQQKIMINQLRLDKSPGFLTASGEIGFDGQLDLQAQASQLPLDLLQVFLARDFSGRCNLRAAADGTVQNPQFTLVASSQGAKLAGVNFDKIFLSVSKKDQTISLNDLTMMQGNQRSQVSGLIPLQEGGQIKLRANLHDNALGLINLLTDQVSWLDGAASASLEAAGKLGRQLDIDGQMIIKNGRLFVPALGSEINELQGTIEVSNNLLQTSGLTGTWQGARTKNFRNALGLKGTVKINQAFNGLVFDLNLSPTWLHIDFPNLYAGNIKINQASLTGPLNFDLQSPQPGPLLKGQAEIDNAVVTLSTKAGGGGQPFPLNFDLNLSLKKNVYATMGDVTTFDLSNIFMNLEIAGDDLAIAGSLARPTMLGKIGLKRGTVSVFNREFSLVSSEDQKLYYTYSPEKIKDNVAVFNGEDVLPDVAISAKVEVENQEQDAAGKPVVKKVIILSRLQGKLGATDALRGLKIGFDAFKEDKTTSPAEMRPAAYSEQDIKVMLLPDFIKSLTGISKGGSKVDTNAVIADYLSSRVSTYVFRGLERELEQRLGLESLTLDYNFGKDLRQAMGGGDTRRLDDQRPDWRVGFVKGFFDKLYLDVRYTQFAGNLGTGTNNTVFNYQLTYKLGPIWSIIYYREPMSPQDLTSGYQKLTLKAGLVLW